MSGILWIGPPGEDDHVARRWMHSYIWTVPGDDPYGRPGLPRANGENYVWATVSNTHEVDAAIGATIDFYFCHYGTAPQRSARLIGSSRVDIAARSSEDVLCVVPLRERRDGCLQVVVRHWLDALPPNWTPMMDRYWNKHTQVGYLNLRIVGAAAEHIEAQAFEIATPGADSTRVKLTLTEGLPGGAYRDRIFERTGLDAALSYEPDLAAYGLSLTPDPEPGWEGITDISVDIPHDESRVGYIVTRTAEGPAGFMCLSAVAHADGRVQGGVSIIVVRTTE